jgi:methylmalonyl-CoA mutase C-terminal domain/subunit
MSPGTLKGKRILIAKPGLDGHDVGAKVIALALRDAGADVIYTGLRKSPEYIARVAVEEDVHALGLSILSGSHKELVAETVEQLRSLGSADIAIFVGGTIPEGDRTALTELGVKGVFTSAEKLDDVIASVAEVLGQHDSPVSSGTGVGLKP